jgi:hypothetical protein
MPIMPGLEGNMDRNRRPCPRSALDRERSAMRSHALSKAVQAEARAACPGERRPVEPDAVVLDIDRDKPVRHRDAHRDARCPRMLADVRERFLRRTKDERLDRGWQRVDALVDPRLHLYLGLPLHAIEHRSERADCHGSAPTSRRATGRAR